MPVKTPLPAIQAALNVLRDMEGKFPPEKLATLMKLFPD